MRFISFNLERKSAESALNLVYVNYLISNTSMISYQGFVLLSFAVANASSSMFIVRFPTILTLYRVVHLPMIGFFFHTYIFQLLNKPWSQVSSLPPPGSCLQFFIANRVQQSQCSSIFHRVLLTHAVALGRDDLRLKMWAPF